MRRAIIPAFLLVLGSVVLGGTVLRAPIASAAQSVGSTIVGPLDSNGNVAVHEQGTANVNVANAPTVKLGDSTQVAFEKDMSENEQATVNVGAYREIRVVAHCSNNDPFGTDQHVFIQVSSANPDPLTWPFLDIVPVRCSAGNSDLNTGTRTYEIPGQRILLTSTANSMHVIVLGRP
jgi:hypothetical protein